ncbi:transglutaminase-like cysteine peptidase [Paucibacter sp. R3-3]|uniref:Transglutaminase-like cysteine peptidase n=1 Tax=Roseateles agri TaxID=3098619 RepID=A0ABU5DRA8_9BURK|nr:transglutaminase-like cysteine peptidase [Paucibacter sp. R3-3]MDY0747794.1 transglutaminase-like cysteine peptidase [Paucibacter sp. R3-3]
MLRIRRALARRAGAMVLGALLATAMPAQGLDNDKLTEAAAKLGPRAVAEVQPLLQMIGRAAALDEEARITLVNNYMNQRIAFREDIDVWGVIDYWATPLEALNKGAGDCEDYAIAKYFSLLSAGMPIAKLRMVYVRASLRGQSLAHMVLAYYAQPGADPLILDNLIPDVRPASQRPDLRPVFSFNSEGLWQGTGTVTQGDPVARLSLWRNLLQKAKAEGF